ncbi:MAG: hypothetical protein MHMPM18_003230 [Marteilia pararefringens]
MEATTVPILILVFGSLLFAYSILQLIVIVCREKLVSCTNRPGLFEFLVPKKGKRGEEGKKGEPNWLPSEL